MTVVRFTSGVSPTTLIPVPTIHAIYASTSGHTEYVLEVLSQALAEQKTPVSYTSVRAELATPEDFSKGDLLLLGSGTWNIDGTEGQLNPYMHTLLHKTASTVDLKKRSCATLALGDKHYYYTGRAGEHLRKFILSHSGLASAPSFMLTEEPYGQEEKIKQWAQKLVTFLQAPPPVKS
jgi:flavodoxin I